MTLRNKLLTFSLVLLAAFASLTAIFWFMAADLCLPMIEESLRDKTRHSAVFLGHQLDLGLASGDRAEVQKVTNDFLIDPDLLTLEVQDKQGKVIFSSGKPLSQIVLPAKLKSLPPLVPLKGDSCYVAWSPVMLEGLELGRVFIAHTGHRLDNALIQMQLYFLLAALVFVCAVLVIVKFSARFVAPIHQMISFSKTLASGVLEHRIDTVATGELSSLQDSLNTMAARLSKRDKDLRFQKKKLGDSLAQVKQMQSELEQSEAHLRAIVQNALDGILIFDLTGSLIEINPAAQEIFQADMATLTQLGLEGLFEIKPDQTQATSWLDIAQTLQSNQVIVKHSQANAKRIDDTQIPLEISVSSFTTGAQRFIAVFCVDVSKKQKLEMDLRQSQKLEAVGSLAAGIAHEINTPIQFVGDNLHFVREAFSEINDLIQKYDQACNQVDAVRHHPEVVEMIHEAKDEADLEYLQNNVPGAFERIHEGMDRVAEIVRAMKQFGYTETKEKTTANLKKAIETTLVVCSNEYKYVADVTTEFATLPLVPCYLGDINQVLLNLIVNAAHAISDAIGDSSEKGSIHIKTGQTDDHVWVEIADSGCGIETAIQDRVFDPFFTTKEVGKGTGQGLAIARSIIIDKHGGNLRFDSQPGKGTTFTIELPLSDPSEELPP